MPRPKTPPRPADDARAIHLHISQRLYDRLRARADREHRSMSAQLRVILEQTLADDAHIDEAA